MITTEEYSLTVSEIRYISLQLLLRNFNTWFYIFGITGIISFVLGLLNIHVSYSLIAVPFLVLIQFGQLLKMKPTVKNTSKESLSLNITDSAIITIKEGVEFIRIPLFLIKCIKFKKNWILYVNKSYILPIPARAFCKLEDEDEFIGILNRSKIIISNYIL